MVLVEEEREQQRIKLEKCRILVALAAGPATKPGMVPMAANPLMVAVVVVARRE